MKSHRKKTETEDTSPVWEYETGVAGMVRHIASGNYYSRFQLHGKRTMKALKTDVFSVAKERHLRKMADIEAERMTGVALEKGKGKVGDLIAEALKAHKGDTSLTEKSKVYRLSLESFVLFTVVVLPQIEAGHVDMKPLAFAVPFMLILDAVFVWLAFRQGGRKTIDAYLAKIA